MEFSTNRIIFIVRIVLNYYILKSSFKATLLDFAILGLIQDTPRSGYNIRMVFETTALGIYSSSPGSIYPALKRLQKNNLVKKVHQFQITPEGVEVLKTWLVKPIEAVDVERNREELFLRFAFMETLLTNEQKLHFLSSFQRLLKVYLKDLKAFHQSEGPNLPIHGRLSFEHGIATCQTTLNWCKKTIIHFKKTS